MTTRSGMAATLGYLQDRINELEQIYRTEPQFVLKAKIDTFKAVIDLLEDETPRTLEYSYDEFFSRKGVEL